MTGLTKKQLDRGLSLAERERTTRWDWGDWAVDVAGPVGEQGHPDGSRAKLVFALDELASKEWIHSSDLPSVTMLIQYRDAASAIPKPLRGAVRSIDVGRKLAQKFPDIRERHTVISEVANENDVVTERALREYLGEKSKDGAVAKERDELRGRVGEADERIERVLQAPPEMTVGELLAGEPMFDPESTWADNLVLRIHTNAEALTARVRREGLRFAPSTPLQEMLDWLLDAERQIAEVRAAVQERVNDERQGAHHA